MGTFLEVARWLPFSTLMCSHSNLCNYLSSMCPRILQATCTWAGDGPWSRVLSSWYKNVPSVIFAHEFNLTRYFGELRRWCSSFSFSVPNDQGRWSFLFTLWQSLRRMECHLLRKIVLICRSWVCRFLLNLFLVVFVFLYLTSSIFSLITSLVVSRRLTLSSFVIENCIWMN